MNKNKLFVGGIWLLMFVLSVFLLLVIPSEYTPVVWQMLIFEIISFISQLFIWLPNISSDSKKFYNLPLLTVSIAYVIFVALLGITVAILSNVISFKLVLILNVLIMGIAWIVLLSLFMSKNHISKIDSRQKNHHIEL